jgi:hypothetical protein
MTLAVPGAGGPQEPTKIDRAADKVIVGVVAVTLAGAVIALVLLLVGRLL